MQSVRIRGAREAGTSATDVLQVDVGSGAVDKIRPNIQRDAHGATSDYNGTSSIRLYEQRSSRGRCKILRECIEEVWGSRVTEDGRSLFVQRAGYGGDAA